MEWCDRILYVHGNFSRMTLADIPGFYWTGFFIVGTAICLVLRSLKKYTGLLDIS